MGRSKRADKNAAAYQGRRWLNQAEADLQTAELLQERQRYEWCCFAAQQTAVKALKAFLAARGGEETPSGDSVVSLCAAGARYDAGLAELQEVIKNLDQYYLAARNPDALPDGIPAKFYDRRDAEAALEMARAALGAVQGRLATM
jgi:HEPN domain-containing protein